MSLKSSNIAIVVLAAGASHRMGIPKQLLQWGNSTLLQHAINTSKSTKANSVFVVLGANYGIIKNEICDTVISVIINYEWQMGLGKSIACAAQTILNSKENFKGVLFTLVDQPFVTSVYLNKMMQSFTHGNKDVIATFYTPSKNGVPVLFDAKYLPELADLTNDEGAKNLLIKYSGFVKSIIPDFKNRDIDTKEDYKSLLEVYLNNKAL